MLLSWSWGHLLQGDGWSHEDSGVGKGRGLLALAELNSDVISPSGFVFSPLDLTKCIIRKKRDP